MKRPALWIVLAAVSVMAAWVGIQYFPRAFSIVALNITMDRRACPCRGARRDGAREVRTSRLQTGSLFTGDDEAQTFVELEGGGKEAFTRMLRDQLYAAYTWRVRHFKEGETNETTIRFTPDGKPYGFVEQVREDAPGAALDGPAARAIAAGRGDAVECRSSPVRRGRAGPGAPSIRPGRPHLHLRTHIRNLEGGSYRLRLVVAGDRLTEVTHYIKIPESFTRRYASMRSANEAIGVGSVVAMALLYVFGGIGVGLFFMMRRRMCCGARRRSGASPSGSFKLSQPSTSSPSLWMTYDTAIPRSTFIAQQLTTMAAGFVGFSTFFALSFMAAETLTRRAFGLHPQLWRSWSAAEPAHRPRSSDARSADICSSACSSHTTSCSTSS